MYVALGLLVQAIGTRWIETLMPPVVTGAVVAVIGLNLAPIAVKGVSGSTFESVMALVTVLCVGGVAVFSRGMVQRLLILVGLVIAYAIYAIATNGMKPASRSISRSSGRRRSSGAELPRAGVRSARDADARADRGDPVAENLGHIKAVSAR